MQVESSCDYLSGLSVGLKNNILLVQGYEFDAHLWKILFNNSFYNTMVSQRYMTLMVN